MKLLAFILLLFMNAFGETENHAQADTIFVNGSIYTGSTQAVMGSTPVQPADDRSRRAARPEAMAVRGDKILALGSSAEMRRFRGKQTKMVDLGGHFVMPGFNDAHLHLAGGGFAKITLDLTGAKSLVEMQQRIAAYAKNLRPGEWIIGRGWDHTGWPDGRLPTRQEIDAASAGHPAFLMRVDGHIGLANTAALENAGITTHTEVPKGGQIDRDATGDLTGIVRESALALVQSKIPTPSPERRRQAIELALAQAARYGVTSMQDYSSWQDFLVYEDLEREAKLTARISEWLTFNDPLPVLEQHRSRHSQTDPRLRTGMLKAFMDGSLGSRTAALLAPYADDPSTRGLPQYEQAALNRMADERVAARFQMGFHAIGDAGVQMALDTFAEAERYAREHNVDPLSSGGFRFRVEHAQVVTPAQVERFAELKVIASMQPSHLLTDMNWALDRLGPERASLSYAWRAFVDHGVALAFGTDFPVESLNPFRGLYAAVTRKNEAGTKEYFPEQKLTMAEAVAAYTTGAAYAEFAEAEKGTLAPGMLADFVVIDRDIFTANPQEILGAKVLRTVVGGETVFAAPGGEAKRRQEDANPARGDQATDQESHGNGWE